MVERREFRYWILLLILVLNILLVVLGGCGIRQQQWEYKVILPVGCFGNTETYAENAETFLNQLGEDGWECSIFGIGCSIQCKRPANTR